MITARPRLVGINHVALEVGDLEAALAFYAAIFELRGVDREPEMAFIDLGDQFLALTHGRSQPPDQARHFGLVVDDKAAVRAALAARGVEILPGPRLDFRDPWGNLVQIVDYRDIQFTKAPAVIRGMGLEHLRKRAAAIRQLRTKGLANTRRRARASSARN
ncbi:MAG TPA: VOC family protein [Solirubrobacteraceae bacterium]|jgi:predicted enzyme related to lactoylglutathione lyase